MGIVRPIKTPRGVVVKGLGAIEGRLLGLDLGLLVLVCALGLLEDRQQLLALDRLLAFASHGIDRDGSRRARDDGGWPADARAERMEGRKSTYGADDLARVIDNRYRLFERHAGDVTWAVTEEAKRDRNKSRPAATRSQMGGRELRCRGGQAAQASAATERK